MNRRELEQYRSRIIQDVGYTLVATAGSAFVGNMLQMPTEDNLAMSSHVGALVYLARQLQNRQREYYGEINDGEINYGDIINEIIPGRRIQDEFIRVGRRVNQFIFPEPVPRVLTRQDRELLAEVGAYHVAQRRNISIEDARRLLRRRHGIVDQYNLVDQPGEEYSIARQE